ncbi:MAG: GNAT family N-acetyltransferase [Planctomycetaceae bacterium]|nr:GNAT family N-acetyltransferase [Planctomycetaceae bacterium]
MPSSHITIERLAADAEPAALRSAFGLVLRTLPPTTALDLATTTMFAARRDAAAFGKLWGAYDANGALRGAIWAQLRPGNVAVVWPPQWIDSSDVAPSLPDPLLEALIGALRRSGVLLAQSLLPDVECQEARTLLAGGFEHLAELTYLSADVAPQASPTPRDDAPAELRFVAYSPADRARLTALVDRSYEGTLDCPALNGTRPTSEVLDEYEAIGTIGTRGWFFVRRQEADVGCLLLADHPQLDQVELVYMALLPKARGCGWGEVITRASLRIAGDFGRARVVLAVDAANTPAAAHYRRAGFRTWETRSAFVCKLA